MSPGAIYCFKTGKKGCQGPEQERDKDQTTVDDRNAASPKTINPMIYVGILSHAGFISSTVSSQLSGGV